MERLNLPIFKEKTHKEKRLTMDEYLRFVIDNLKYTVNMPIARKLKKGLFVGRKFIL